MTKDNDDAHVEGCLLNVNCVKRYDRENLDWPCNSVEELKPL